VRWWLLREVPRVGDADFTVERLIARADDELANGIGNLVNRVVSMIHRYRDGHVPDVPGLVTAPDGADALLNQWPDGADVARQVAAALADFDFRKATEAVWAVADQANRTINEVRPWDLAKDPGAARRLDVVLAGLYGSCTLVARELTPFLPDAAERIAAQLGVTSAAVTSAGGAPAGPSAGPLPRPSPIFRHLGAYRR
jgi:methionyl-tRNA synthetase